MKPGWLEGATKIDLLRAQLQGEICQRSQRIPEACEAFNEAAMIAEHLGARRHATTLRMRSGQLRRVHRS